jgi:hypothetical protein
MTTKRELAADHAMGVELQLIDAVAALERARRDSPGTRARDVEQTIDELQVELARAAEEICRVSAHAGDDPRRLTNAALDVGPGWRGASRV